MLATGATVIVDEIHAVADDKRGSHLALSLERLDALAGRAIPAHRAVGDAEAHRGSSAQFLAGAGRGRPDHRAGRRRRELDLAVEVPRERAGAGRVERDVGRGLRPARGAHPRASIDARVRQHAAAGRARRASSGRAARRRVRSPRTTAACRARLGSTPSTGSRPASCSALVATASLELGIDVGTVDLVCQIGSPRSIAVARAAHRPRRALARRGARRAGCSPRRATISLECAALVARDPPRRARPIDHSRRAARHPGAADRRDVRRRRSGTKTSCSRSSGARYPYRDLPRARVRRDRRDALRGHRRASADDTARYLHHDRVNGRLQGAARRAARGHHERRRDSGNRALYRRRRAGGHVVGTRGRGLRRREPGRRHHAARQHVVAHPAREHRGRVHRRRRARRGADDSVLERRGAVAHDRAVAATCARSARDDVSRLDADAASGGRPMRPAIDAAVDWLTTECGLDRAGAEQVVDYVVSGPHGPRRRARHADASSPSGSSTKAAACSS